MKVLLDYISGQTHGSVHKDITFAISVYHILFESIVIIWTVLTRDFFPETD